MLKTALLKISVFAAALFVSSLVLYSKPPVTSALCDCGAACAAGGHAGNYDAASGTCGGDPASFCPTGNGGSEGGNGGPPPPSYTNGCTVGLSPNPVTAGGIINITVTGVPNKVGINGSVAPTGQCGGVVGTCAGSPNGNCTGTTTAQSNILAPALRILPTEMVQY